MVYLGAHYALLFERRRSSGVRLNHITQCQSKQTAWASQDYQRMFGTHGSRRSEWRWCPGRCSVARSDPASPASGSESSRVSPASPSRGSRREWTRSPAGTWTKPPALLPALGGGRRAERRGTPRSGSGQRPPTRWSRLRETKERRWRLEGRGWREHDEDHGHIYARVYCNVILLPSLPLSPLHAVLLSSFMCLAIEFLSFSPPFIFWLMSITGVYMELRHCLYFGFVSCFTIEE